MRQNKFLIGIIFIITLYAVLINIPSVPLNIHAGPININRTLHPLEFNIHLGPINIVKSFPPKFGLDLSGGTHLVLEADMTGVAESDRKSAFDAAKTVVERRVNLYGLTEPVIQQSKVGNSYRIIAEIPGVTDVHQAVDLIGKTAQLTFREEASESAKVATPSGLLEVWPKETKLTGKQLKKSEVTFDPKTGVPQVSLEFDEAGSKLFSDITSRNIGKTLAIFLDNELLSAPNVSERIDGGKAVINGSFGVDEAKKLSIALNAGALPVPLKPIEERNIGATLGQSSIDKSLLAGGIGLTIIAVFMIVQYGILGIVAVCALVIYTFLTLAIFKIIPVTLTLAGIAGFILSVGMAVDANILIFERMKEERGWGHSFVSALRLGFDRAYPSIRDSNVSSLLTCGILYYFGSGTIRGFAITLAIGILVSLFSAVVITRTFLGMIYKD
ncbi:protein-export membrane protein SecD [Candidatus Gottesmanbacteria bacterium RIFCSPHIGHO2_02_FULL_39_11]|uniref:Protein translocase subunit SecD n=1 Tax=Candidatus Gottesmanbacteria bacterium RIFCSPHIGHO2_02_FULL_39_11 TaxID=1798382 RepID=A0A1F5ZTH4_9BACT|nr:MAG: protein-export membrane protein SecD [Candidatus Gottesmanbacteria bacterium RIFCSPHIGHO2_02_FULL_39_11]